MGDTFGDLDQAARDRASAVQFAHKVLSAWKLRATAIRYTIADLEQLLGTPKPLSEMTGEEVVELLRIKALQLEEAIARGESE